MEEQEDLERIGLRVARSALISARIAARMAACGQPQWAPRPFAADEEPGHVISAAKAAPTATVAPVSATHAAIPTAVAAPTNGVHHCSTDDESAARHKRPRMEATMAPYLAAAPHPTRPHSHAPLAR